MLSNILYLISKALKTSRLPAIKNSCISSYSKICSGCLIVNCKINKYSYVGHNSTIINSQIGSFCSIADNVIIGGASHPITWVSTSPAFTEGKNILNKNFSTHSFNASKQTNIGSDVWIGNNAIIKSGIDIGHGAIIGMGAIVTKSIPPYEIWGGNPARLIKKRFSDEISEQLLKSEWWNFPEEKLVELAPLFDDVENFIKNQSK